MLPSSRFEATPISRLVSRAHLSNKKKEGGVMKKQKASVGGVRVTVLTEDYGGYDQETKKGFEISSSLKARAYSLEEKCASCFLEREAMI
jgi:hypothetical protein